MADTRVTIRGKYFFAGENKLYIRGVTYGTFRPDDQGAGFPPRDIVEQDFRQMAVAGFNAVRVYVAPPVWLLDLAWKHGLYVMVGLPWEQHLAFLDQPGMPASIERRVREAVSDSAGHPAVLCYVVGNEIPSSIVRWHGQQKIERFIRRLYRAVKAVAPKTLVTYVNYPTTAYLHLPFIDFFCFNVYLETREKLEAYLGELQNVAGDRPLVMAEIGLDSRRNGEATQSQTLQWQIRSIFESGCAGMFIFAWTDEWYRGGYEIDDWDFGLTMRNRNPKAALAAVSSVLADVPFPRDAPWPAISVVVCTHNGSRTIRDCLEGLRRLDYPHYEIIVVDDGSVDDTASIAREFGVRLIQMEHRGLASARNSGIDAALGEIIAYTDDDARPDPHWLQYIAWTFMHTDYAAVGGPNILPPEDGPVSECVSNAPGGPVHVLLTDREAEHIPGCNLSFRTDRLKQLRFDVRFQAAGDDVDVCWRLLECGWKIGFHAGAMVWHHRRDSVRSYLTQQMGYGHAEALLEAKWPEKYTPSKDVRWTGRLYGRGITQTLLTSRVYHGFWGTAPFQRLYSPRPGKFPSQGPTIEWYVLVLVLAGLLLLAPFRLLTLALIPLFILVTLPVLNVVKSVAEAPFVQSKLRYRFLTVMLHVMQPAARFLGRMSLDSTHTGPRPSVVGGVRGRILRIWSEHWNAPDDWLRSLEGLLRSQRLPVRRGGDFDAWDLEVSSGLTGSARLKIAIEEHGAGRQMVLFHVQPRLSEAAVRLLLVFTLLCAASVFSGKFWIGAVWAVPVFGLLVRVFMDCSIAANALDCSVQSLSRSGARTNEELRGIVYLGSS